MKKLFSLILSAVIVFGSASIFAEGTENIEINNEFCGEYECEECIEYTPSEEEETEEYDEVFSYDYELCFAEINDEDTAENNSDGRYDVLDIEEIELDEGITVAASCKHDYKETYSSESNEKHRYSKTCTKCGKMAANNKLQSHVPDGTKNYSQKDSNYHNVIMRCKKCSQNYTKQVSHSFSKSQCKYCGYKKEVKCSHSSKTTTYQKNDSDTHYQISSCKACGIQVKKSSQKHSFTKTVSASKINDSNHSIVKQCSKCGQQITKQEAHNFSSGKCKNCGFKKTLPSMNASDGISYNSSNKSTTVSASHDGQGYCFQLGSIFKTDKNIYASCPKCKTAGSDSTYIKTVKIGTQGRVGDFKKFTVYHQFVKCNNCGKKYYNYCYMKYN